MDGNRLVLPRHRIELGQGEDRAVLTDKFFSHIASAAHADTAFHSILQGHDDVIMGIIQLFQNRLGKLDDDRRSADDHIGIVTARGCLLFRNGGHQTDIVGPVRIIGAVYGDMHMNIVPLFPLGQLIFVEKHTGASGPIDDMDILEVGTVGRVQHVYDRGSKGGKGEAGADNHHVLPLHFFPGIPVAQRPPDAHDVAHLHGMEMGCDEARFIYGELDKALLCRGRGDADGDFALSGHRQFSELAGMIGESFFVFWIQKDELKCLQVLIFRFGDNLINANRIWEIWILQGFHPLAVLSIGRCAVFCFKIIHEIAYGADVDVNRTKADASAAAHTLYAFLIFIDIVF